MATLREQCLAVLAISDVDQKAAGATSLDFDAPVGASKSLSPGRGLPGRPSRPSLVPANELPKRSHHSLEGHAALVHSIVHIELNAVDLALDICWRFSNLPNEFYCDWAGVAKEEAYHFQMLRDHLHTLGFKYGDFPAHNGLWDLAERTKDDVLARLALVPRLAEAKGLDASPAVKAKLLSVGDQRGGEILDIILRDEIGHVATGNRWFRHLCDIRGLDPRLAYAALVDKYKAPRLRGPFNLEARKAAGFSDAELDDLQRG